VSNRYKVIIKNLKEMAKHQRSNKKKKVKGKLKQP